MNREKIRVERNKKSLLVASKGTGTELLRGTHSREGERVREMYSFKRYAEEGCEENLSDVRLLHLVRI